MVRRFINASKIEFKKNLPLQRTAIGPYIPP
jgi:hypothetical protein